MTIRWVFKNGYSFDTVCKDFSSGVPKIGSTGMITSWEAQDITKNKPIGIDFSELIAVYRLVEDETAGGEPDKICWCKDCESYREGDDGMICVNHESDWCADYPPEHCSCEYCEPRER